MVRTDLYSSLIYNLIITAFYWSWVAFEIWLISRDRGTVKNDSEDRGSRNTIIFWWSFGILPGIFAIPNLLPGLTIPGNSNILFATGIFLISAGILLRFWSVRKLGKFFRSTIVIQEKHKLITTGPYKYLRNPSYTGVLLTFIGFGIGIGNWLSLISLFIIGLISFARRISFENQALPKKFGKEYEEYQKKTWLLLPFIW
jgi:protein-S-isoprenylcysteine O-methyltransferase